MLYFIPAWYQQNRWRESEQSWYTRRMHTEFDDTVKQVQLFARSGMTDYKILLLSYTPNFRHFLHRQGVFHAPYWSCFDAIQEVTRKKITIFSFHNLDWPKNIEFVYTPFSVLAFLNGKKYAQIEFGEAGNPIEVLMYEGDLLVRRNIYDDRGFVSATEVYDAGVLKYTDFLTEKGIRKMRQFADSGKVEINSKHNTFLIAGKGKIQHRIFEKTHYDNISEVILEVLNSHLENDGGGDIFCIAAHELNFIAAKEIIKTKKCIFSFYGERYKIGTVPADGELIDKAAYLITDSEATTKYLIRDLNRQIDNVIDITPYDSRMDFGISQELTIQNILVPVDDLPEDRFNELIGKLAEYVQTNENAMVHIFTRNAEYDLPDRLLDMVAGILDNAGYDRRMAIAEQIDETAENDLDDEETDEVPVRFFVDQCVDELSVSKCIREQRIMVDMRHYPDLYLQINCISTAIPQIVRRKTQYIKDGENGFIVQDISKVIESIDYFLGTLSNWNKAKVCSYELGQQFTTKKLLEKWKMVMGAIYE